MKKYILTVIGIAVISIICNAILTEGKIKKYAQFAFSVILSLALIFPTADFLKEKIFAPISFDFQNVDYLFSVEQTVKAFYKNATVSVVQNGNKIEKIYIDLSQEKILDKAQAEILKGQVKEILSAMYQVDEENINFNF